MSFSEKVPLVSDSNETLDNIPYTSLKSADEDYKSSKKYTEKPDKTNLELLALTSSLAAVQFSYAIEFAFGTPWFRERGVSYAVIPFIWLAGPFSGFIVQPVIGVLSDRCRHPWGRRRPFIFMGALLIVFGMLVLSTADPLGSLFGERNACHSPTEGSQPRCTFTVTLGIIGLWILNIAINVVQGPARAIVADLVNTEQQTKANSILTGVMGLSNLFGNLLGRFVPAEVPLFGSNFRFLFSLGMILVPLSVLPTLLLGHERPLGRQPASLVSSTSGILGVFLDVWRSFVSMPKEMSKVSLVYFLSWAAFSPFQFYTTDWIGKSVMHGDPQKASGSLQRTAYEEGVRIGALALAGLSLVMTVFSAVQTFFVELLGVRKVYAMSQIFFGFLCLIPILVNLNTVWAVMLVSLLGIHFSIFNALPFALVASVLDGANTGLYMGVLNASCVVAQVVGNFTAGKHILVYSMASNLQSQ
ncbi:sucrose transporter, GPH family isoform 1 [Galdieria sulphuraria]|uniref:Sucrose transporter, GPH family isoform 1 n=1 Tax=Galdieria sulphuraria TaxID=130081 RepID=M2X344_GALSU|nr:sucrose transporter, GPH family isoform 1 [Galdieria sulphuraria]EME30800.1 sucrose transporter, GPH family isoform 1 [Galdieria sulphuraria]|eukprot:XP_005707320.1 sucrose transporter, GPH family isoform 1 [Galdieria sulphuraria]